MMSGSGDGGRGDRRRRYWTPGEKRRIVEESERDGASMAEIARRHDVNANLVFTWRRKMAEEAVAQTVASPILPLMVTPDMAPAERGPESAGQIEIVLADGDRILVWSDVDTSALSRVLKALSRR